jgi:branched-chain amino acid transport system permease protein
MELIVFRPLRTKKASDMALLLASLGLYVLIQNVISLLFGDDTKSIRRGAIKGGIQIIGATITSVQVKIILTSLILSCLVAIALRRTRLGRSVRAVANDPELASIMGIESDRVILFVFVLGSGLAGFGAILASLDTDITPTMGFRALLMGVIALFAGGAGSPLGAIVGGFLLGVTQHLCVWKLPTHWQDAIVFGILVLFLLFKPEGFLGGDSGKVGG